MLSLHLPLVQGDMSGSESVAIVRRSRVGAVVLSIENALWLVPASVLARAGTSRLDSLPTSLFKRLGTPEQQASAAYLQGVRSAFHGGSPTALERKVWGLEAEAQSGFSFDATTAVVVTENEGVGLPYAGLLECEANREHLFPDPELQENAMCPDSSHLADPNPPRLRRV